MNEIADTIMMAGIYIGTFSTALIAFSKSPLGAFLMRAVRREANDLMLKAAQEANAPLEDKLDNLTHYTKYHLGPNTDSTPIHVRITNLEKK